MPLIKKTIAAFAAFFLIISLNAVFTGCTGGGGKENTEEAGENAENDEYDGPELAAKMEWERTKDPALGVVPRNRLVSALRYADNLRNVFSRLTTAGAWTERGPSSDAVCCIGNSRPNSGITAGRVRGVLIDVSDPSHNTVWVGGVCGGLWKTTDITVSAPTWVPQSDFFSNMAITSICQDPVNNNIMYFATGEWTFNADAVPGDGVWKSTNNGVTWSQLSATTGASFDYCSKILCDASGNLYVATRSGVFRSNNGGSTFTTITPSGLSTARFSDMELSSTGRLHVSAGQFSTCAYRYTDNPSTVASGTWTSPVSGYPASSTRIELACAGNTLIALPSDASYQVPTIYKSTDGGANWTPTVGQPTSGWASQQAWYSLAATIDSSNTNNMIIGGLEPYKTTDGGTSWSKIANWVGSTGQYVHADIHYINWFDNNRVLFGCDGGIHYSSDAGVTIRDRNTGLRIKQFYSVDFHPTTTDYFLTGAQDNGTHRFTNPGLSSSTEVVGGDGAFVHIDQNEPQYQFAAYVYNQYRRSTNSGTSWSSSGMNFSSTLGQFINPTDYDDAGNVMYCAYSAGNYLRWTNPQTGTTTGTVNIPEFNASSVLAVTVSPYISNRVYFGTAGGRVVYVDNANTIASGSSGTNISTGLPAAATSCIAVGTNDNFLMACYSSYGVNQVNVSTDGGNTWTAIDGNLPDMPVRWCMFYPGDNTKAIIATEAGVWITELINSSITSWYPSPTFPLVRTDMIKYRSGDGILAAATHGRGLWTQSVSTILPLDQFTLSGTFGNNDQVTLDWFYEKASANTKFEVLVSTNGSQFTKAADISFNGTKNYRFTQLPPSSKVFYRIKATEYNAIVRYSNVIKLDRSRAFNSVDLLPVAPNPAISNIMLQYSASDKGQASFDIMDAAHRTVLSRKENITAAGSFAVPWNVSALPKGTYTIVMRMNGVQATQKMVKQ